MKFSKIVITFGIGLILLLLFASEAGAFEDTVERYPTGSYTDYWTFISDGSIKAGADVEYNSAYHTNVLSVHCIAYYDNNRYIGIKSVNTIETPVYLSFIIRSTGHSKPLYIQYANATTGTAIVTGTVPELKSNTKYEVIWGATNMQIYENGTLVNTVATAMQPNVTVFIYHHVGGGSYGTDQNSNTFYIDDITTSSTIGLPEIIDESDDYLQFTWSSQLLRSYMENYTIKLYSLSNTDNAGLLKTWDLGYGIGLAEFGSVNISRAATLGNNYGLYLLEMTRGNYILTDQYFYYDQLSNPVGFPDVIFLASSDVAMEIRDADNNGGTIAAGGKTYLFPSDVSSTFPIYYKLKETPAGFTANLTLVYGQNVSATQFLFSGLSNSYIVSVDGTPISGAQASGTLSFTGNVSDGETITIGADTYEFNSTNTITEGHIEVNPGDNLTQTVANLVHEINVNGTELVSASGSAVTGTQNYYSAPITVTNNPGVSNYQAAINLTYHIGMSEDFSNIRFYNDSAEIPYWIQNASVVNSVNATFWIPINATTNLTCRWGISGETASKSNISAVMEFGDEFNALNSTWSSAGTTVSDGIATITATNGDSYIRTASLTWGTGYTLMERVKTSRGGGYASSTYERPAGWMTGTYESYFGTYESSSPSPRIGNIYTSNTPTAFSISWPANTYEIVNASRAPSTFTVSTLGSAQSSSSNYYTGTMSPSVRAISQSSGITSKVYVDWLCIRKYAATEPSLTLGSITSPNGSGSIVIMADNGGTTYNLISTTDTCVNAAWGALTLTGGADGADVTTSAWNYTITDWTNINEHIFTFSPDLTKPGLYGYVKDADTTYPIARATVKMVNGTTTMYAYTDSTGLYYVPGATVGDSFTISATKSGYDASATTTVVVKAGETTRQDVYLTSTAALQGGEGIYYAAHYVGIRVVKNQAVQANIPIKVYIGSNTTAASTNNTGYDGVTAFQMSPNVQYKLEFYETDGTTLISSVTLYPSGDFYTFDPWAIASGKAVVTSYSTKWLTTTFGYNTDTKALALYYNVTDGSTQLANFTIYKDGVTVYTGNSTANSHTFNTTMDSASNYNVVFNITNTDGRTHNSTFPVVMLRGLPSGYSPFGAGYPQWLKNCFVVGFAIVCLCFVGGAFSFYGLVMALLVIIGGWYMGILQFEGTPTPNTSVIISIIAGAAVAAYFKWKKISGE